MWKWLKRKKNKFKSTAELLDEEEEFSLEMRSSKELATRAIALSAVIGKIHNGDPEKYEQWLYSGNILECLTDAEKDFVLDENPDRNSIIQFSWKSECMVSIFWALGIIKEMPPLNQQFNILALEEFTSMTTAPKVFVDNAHLIDHKEITEMEGHLYHQHWRVRDAQLKRQEMPEELDPGVVYERRYALSWIIGYGDDWENVPTDT